MTLSPSKSTTSAESIAAECTIRPGRRTEPPPGARVRPLAVAGAFHTAYMQPAQDRLGDYARTLDVQDPRPTLLSNADGAAVTTGTELLARLVGQVTRPVRWDLCMEAMTARGVTTIVELAPGGTLTGLAKRAMKGVELVPVKSPADLDAARAAIAAAGGAS